MRGEVLIRYIISSIRKDSVVVNHLNEEFPSPYKWESVLINK